VGLIVFTSSKIPTAVAVEFSNRAKFSAGHWRYFFDTFLHARRALEFSHTQDPDETSIKVIFD
jgi:hypothetical protein